MVSGTQDLTPLSMSSGIDPKSVYNPPLALQLPGPQSSDSAFSIPGSLSSSSSQSDLSCSYNPEMVTELENESSATAKSVEEVGTSTVDYSALTSFFVYFSPCLQNIDGSPAESDSNSTSTATTKTVIASLPGHQHPSLESDGSQTERSTPPTRRRLGTNQSQGSASSMGSLSGVKIFKI